jgi:cell division transport system ATP-binding protein
MSGGPAAPASPPATGRLTPSRPAAGRSAPRRSGDPLIRLFHVSKSFGTASFALRDVSLEVRKGEMVFLTGPSGAGKTTLMKLLFAAERPSEGQILVLGRNVGRLRDGGIPELRRRIGVVFQDFKLIANRSVEQNVALVLEVLGRPPREVRSKVFAMLRRVGLHHHRHQLPPALSGGEQQRVALARALVNEPAILLADEPTGNLDAQLTIEIMDLIATAAARGTTVLVATHDHGLIRRYARRALRLEAGQLVDDVQIGGAR